MPNLVDQDFIWDTHGHGIYEHDCSNQTFAHNFIGRSTGAGLHLHGRITDLRIDGHEPEYGLHQVRNNLMCENTKSNVFGGKPSVIAGNVSDGITAVFDRETRVLTVSAVNGLSPCETVPEVSSDFFGNLRKGGETIAGPFIQIPAHSTKIRLGR